MLAIFVILCINPWRTVTGDESPFTQIFSSLQHGWSTGVAGVLNFVLITAALSAINSDIFGAGRIITGMAQEKLAPKVFTKLYNDVPIVTVAALIVVLSFGVWLNYIIPEEVFAIIAALATFATIFVWLMILLAHVASRRRMSPHQVQELQFPVPFWPYGQYFAIAFILFTFGIMVWQSSYHEALIAGIGFTVIMTAIYFFTGRGSTTHSIE